MLQHPQELLRAIHKEDFQAEAIEEKNKAIEEDVFAMRTDLINRGFCNIGIGFFNFNKWTTSEILEEFQSKELFEALAELDRSKKSETGTLAAVAVLRGLMDQVINEALTDKATENHEALICVL